MDAEEFIETITPRFGEHNAVRQIVPIKLKALTDLLIENGLIDADGLDKKEREYYALSAKDILAIPVPSPIQVKKK